MSFFDKHEYLSTRVNALLEPFVKKGSTGDLNSAMAYSLFNGGKRLRPVLVYAACEALGGTYKAADLAAAAIECIHTYSLIHDDLPAIDNDELRRGKPACHIAYDESTAILAGDALHALAFEILSLPSSYVTPSGQLEMIKVLANAAGAKGMVAGQIIDMMATGSNIDMNTLERMHRLKTGALIRASVQLGALAAGFAPKHKVDVLIRYADAIGLAFQIRDDVLDLEGKTQTLGKNQGADIKQGKVTYPSLIGLEESQVRVAELYRKAISALDDLDEEALLLRHIADYIICRRF